ncbi:3'(2'),5'-bisphosphate nucleotidase CysQ [Devosia salina]|uniref:3'(2'),5'-bisphosphate nucleotidase CysQ n=1 Tax=Devosia salina TaxID=2860336 RepID=A0ABX8WAH9_9HYPH|nr:3'(2'),5'-bisphosphate nucleotidase CysQ [Devosia salina]QYO75094.1 3'(2'),5'-bisphosphate nucleotidase CysQ [Devosia salina]
MYLGFVVVKGAGLVEVRSLCDVALLAGQEILRVYATDFDVEIKADQSPVTIADTAAEAIILRALHEMYPGIPVVAEEAVSAGDTPAIENTFFLVDPLDGSKEFVSKNGEFTVNIAVVVAGEPVMGVVYAPALGKLWWGAKGQGSFYAKVVDGCISEAHQIGVREASSGLRAVGSRSHGSGEGDERLSRLPIRDYVSAGSSLKFCLVASGEADVYPRLGRTMEWDTAAGDAVLRAAGGRVERLDGGLLVYGKRQQVGDVDFANPFFIAYGDTRFCQMADAV